MRGWWARSLLMGLGLVALACSAAQPSPSPGPEGSPSSVSAQPSRVGAALGDQVPPFEIRTVEGAVSSSSLLAEGKPVFLFFFATW